MDGRCFAAWLRFREQKLEIVPEEAKIVRLAFEKYLIFRSEIAVAEWLNNNGYTTLSKGNGKFTHMRVSSMLKNVLYIGKVPHKDKVYDGQHHAIISQELFDEVQKSKARTASADLRRPVLLNMLCLKGLFIAIVVRRR